MLRLVNVIEDVVVRQVRLLDRETSEILRVPYHSCGYVPSEGAVLYGESLGDPKVKTTYLPVAHLTRFECGQKEDTYIAMTPKVENLLRAPLGILVEERAMLIENERRLRGEVAALSLRMRELDKASLRQRIAWVFKGIPRGEL